MKLKLATIERAYTRFYDRFYKSGDACENYRLYVEYGETISAQMPDVYREFCRYHGDVLTSDRELAAYGCAILGIVIHGN